MVWPISLRLNPEEPRASAKYPRPPSDSLTPSLPFLRGATDHKTNKFKSKNLFTSVLVNNELIDSILWILFKEYTSSTTKRRHSENTKLRCQVVIE